jgi:hypothetical protein
MYEYLTQHPLVLRAKRRETHYLDWRWRDGVADVGEQLATCEFVFCVLCFFGGW